MNINRYITLSYVKLQRLLSLDLSYFLKSGAYNSIQQAIGIVSGLIISYFFGHFASIELFGNYNYVLTVVGFLTIITLPGIDSYLIRSVGLKYDSSYIRTVKYKLKSSSIGLLILLIISAYYFLQGQNSLAIGFVVASLFFPFLESVQLFNEFFIAKRKFKNITIILSASSVLSLILLCLSIFFTKSIIIVLLAYFTAIFLPSLYGFIYSLKFISKNKKKDKDLLKVGLFMTGLSILPWTAGYLGQIILAAFLGTQLLAIFVVAHKITLYVHKNFFVFHKPITAKLAGQSQKEHLNTLRKHSMKLVLWGLVISLPLYFLSPYIIMVIFTQKYDQAIPLAQLLALSLIPLPITWVTDDIIIFQKILKPQLYASLAINIIKIILYFVLIPIYKLYGLVFVYLFDRYITLIINLLIIRGNRYTK